MRAIRDSKPALGRGLLLAGGLLLTSLPLGCGDSGGGNDGSGLACRPVEGTPIDLDEAKLFFEFQSTDDDTGLHGAFDGEAWSELCISGPGGIELMAIKPLGELGDFGLSGFFFESREPEAGELPQEEVLALFPEGMYEVIGTTFEGDSLVGTAILTHDIPAPPVIVEPGEGEVVDPDNLVIRWDPVTVTVKGDPVTITGYEVIVTNEDKAGDDPNGMSDPVASIHVPATVQSLRIPSEFLEPDTEYELELIAIEESGNQTITVLFFDTP